MSDYTQGQLQSYWDAALIKHWRLGNQLWDAIAMWEAITSRDFIDTPLLRKPHAGYPFKSQVRVFIATHLSKLNDRLWSQKPERDVVLLKALGQSKYDTHKALRSAVGNDMQRARRGVISATEKIALNSHAYETRNRATDWGTTKASRRHTR